MLDRQDKTNRVFDAALKVFAHFGYRQATMELIANELDMVKGSLYSYCSGKKDLYNKAVAFALEVWQAKVLQAAEAEKDIVQKLVTLAVVSNEYLADNNDLRTIIINDPQIQSISPTEDRYPNIGVASFDAIKNILRQGVQEKRFKSIDIDLVTGFIYSIHCMFIVKTYIKAEGQSAQEMYHAGIELVLNGLLAEQ
jgi:AcrR family transcriptional regulator